MIRVIGIPESACEDIIETLGDAHDNAEGMPDLQKAIDTLIRFFPADIVDNLWAYRER